ncbi:MAG: aldo/keto reductase [Chloroflexi bacterium]|nr:aldo/keto reductase [Chloroflexota bacterium]MDA1002219.1 aldo/keto reductase [Chloroflexota bacterium]
MEYRNLGRSGLQVSIVGIGCNNFGGRMDAKATDAVVGKALDMGITLFDSADVYGGAGKSEEFLGKALKGKREDAIVATKFAMKMGEGPMKSGGSRRYIMQAVEDSLRRLETDYIDLYQMHAPDPTTPTEETVRALDDLVTSGKVRYLGNSNYAGWQIANASWVQKNEGLEPFVSAQNQYSLLDRSIEREVIPACEAFGLGMLPFFPLASGLLTGKYRRGESAPEGTRLAAGPMGERMLTDQNFDIVEKLEDWARAHDHTILELAFSWLATKPYISSVIAGATKPEQVDANAAAAAWRLTDAEMAEVDQISKR